MTKTKKLLIAAVCLVAILTTAVVGTIAWLSDTATVTNTFSPSNIDITLTESENLNLKMVPGTTITKDPKVTVEAGSEACWLFVKIDENLGAWAGGQNTFSNYLTYSVITTGTNGWTPLDGVSGVYYLEGAASTADQTFNVLVDNKVNVLGTVTKDMMDALYNNDGTVKTAAVPTLTFTAYAIQQVGFGTATAAWTEVVNTWHPTQTP